MGKTTMGVPYEAYLADRKGCDKTFRYRLARLETLVGGRGRLLEVGCADGFFMTVATAHGWAPEGVESGADLAGLPESSFNAVIMNHGFEQLEDPGAELRQIRRVLMLGGVVMVIADDTHYRRQQLAAMIAEAGFGGAWVKVESIYCTVDFMAAQLARSRPSAGKLLSGAAGVLHMGQVVLPEWNGHRVAATGYRPREAAPGQLSSSKQVSSEHFS
jgi:hypothetical protein